MIDKTKYLLFTHSDYDHIIGYGKFKNYKTIASENFIKNKDVTKIIKQIQAFDDECYVEREYEIEYPKIEISISEEYQAMKLGLDEYEFYQARGHNADGIIIYNKSKEILIAGDCLSNI